MRRMSAADVQKLVDEWRTRKVNALLAMVGSLLQRSGKTPSLVQDGVRQKSPMVALKPAPPTWLLLSCYQRALEKKQGVGCQAD